MSQPQRQIANRKAPAAPMPAASVGVKIAAVDAAQHHAEQQQHAPDAPEGSKALDHGQPFPRRAGRRVEMDGDDDGADVAADREQPRQDAGDEQLADVLLRQDAVDDHHHRGRDQDAERAAGGDRTRGERVGVAEALHRRHRHLGHGGGRGDRRARDGREAAARDDGGHGEPAAPVPQEGMGGLVQLLRQSGPRDQIAHQHEQRHDRERVRQAGLVRHRARHGEGGRHTGLEGEAGEADQPHREGDRQPREREQQHGGEGDQRFGHGVPSGRAASNQIMASITAAVRKLSTAM